MTARGAKLALAVAFGAAVLSVSACVNEIVVGDQREPITGSDAGDADPAPDAATPEPDAGPEPGLDAGPDAEPADDAASADAQPSPADAAPDEGCPVIVYWYDTRKPDAGDAGCVDGACAAGDAGDTSDAGAVDVSCAPEARPLGPCSLCSGGGVEILVMPDACPSGPPPVCWEDDEISCSVQCPNTASCSSSSQCAPDEYCYFAERDCGAAELGWCARRPFECSSIGAAVCGCDGQRYENGCFAAQAGVHNADDAHAQCP